MVHEASICITGNAPLLQTRLQDMVFKEKGFSLSAASGAVGDTLQRIKQHKPDVAVVAMGDDTHELKAIVESIKRQLDIPVIVLAQQGELRFTAEQAGASDFIQTAENAAAFGSLERDLIMRIRLASAARAAIPIFKEHTDKPKGGPLIQTAFNGVLALGASTGGTDAINEVICRLPRNMPGIAIVQHMPPGFTSMYAQRLDRECAMHVIEAKGTHKLERGLVLLAPGDTHMRVVKRADGFYTECFEGDKVSGHKPSVDVLFSSVAECAGRNAAGIILTGMGADGANGLLEMRKKGAYTIGQDEQSSVVYGMPRVAFEKGAVQVQVPLRDVADTLVKHLGAVR